MSETVESRLLRLAEKAREKRWMMSWYLERELRNDCQGHARDSARLIVACDPDTVAKLCKVAEAARWLSWHPNDSAAILRLRVTLGALDALNGERV